MAVDRAPGGYRTRMYVSDRDIRDTRLPGDGAVRRRVGTAADEVVADSHRAEFGVTILGH